MALSVLYRGWRIFEMKQRLLVFMSVCTATFLTAGLMASDNEPVKRLDEAAAVLSEVMHAEDKAIPRDLLDRAKCVAIVPGMKKAAFIVGAKYGKGFISCRGQSDRAWSAPAAIRIEGGSFGFQIGGEETDVIMLVMNDQGMGRLLSSKFTLGGEGEVAAGPVGRDASAQTDAKLTAEILSYSRSRGIFAGISLQGATLREDLDDNEAIYGRKLSNREIVTGGTPIPASAQRLVNALDRRSPEKR
jgi:lipid-binding SYLF domain-containing protein